MFFALFLAAGMLPFSLSAATDAPSLRKSAFLAFQAAESGFRNPSNSLPQLQAEFQEFPTNYPGSKFEQQAGQTVDVLTRMMAEE
jgi:outer membrane protein assembly factor BamD (BamD/ComL family)